tara:strand:+ start:3487 stop:3654 length:168 start_codon:yes stop_codon:yes gene_type:complete
LPTPQKVPALSYLDHSADKSAVRSVISQIPQPLISVIQKDKSADGVEYQVFLKPR